ncbi:hypothetical protein PZE06_29095, partial [Robertmurraya sp. DFI.2.37]|uniref:hypothetical protein n=1 Tax=Robertmurraya sp. DFI.2.37 TaxID=3031819 RepID=UPI0023DB2B61
MAYGYPGPYAYPTPYPPPYYPGSGAWAALWIVLFVLLLIFFGWWYFGGVLSLRRKVNTIYLLAVGKMLAASILALV